MGKEAENVVERVVEEKGAFQPQQPPKRTGNVFATRLQSLFMNALFYFW
jgi:hypothetical protein